MAIERLGFVGCGNMASALIRGIGTDSMQIGACDPAGKFPEGVRGFSTNRELAEWADFLVLAVKPQVVEEALRQIGDAMANKAVVSIAAGVPQAKIAAGLPGARVCRVMPNTPALVGQGMTVVATPHTLLSEESSFLLDVLGKVGVALALPEAQIAAVTALSGSGPAYFFVLIEAMADEGVRLGLPRALAYQLASQTVLGAGAMATRSGKIPAALKDDVCSPGGTAIEAVAALERAGARAAMMEAVRAAYQKAKDMEKAE